MYISDVTSELISGSEELLYDFLAQYNDYVQNFYDEHDEGSYPVSIPEFYENDFVSKYK